MHCLFPNSCSSMRWLYDMSGEESDVGPMAVAYSNRWTNEAVNLYKYKLTHTSANTEKLERNVTTASLKIKVN